MPRSPRFLLALLVLTTLALSGCAFGPPDEKVSDARPPKLAKPTKSPGPRGQETGIQDVATGLEVPWGLAFLPDGAAVVTERGGRLLRVTAAGEVTQLQDLAGIISVADGGLMGVAVPPAFGTDHTLFIYYTTPSDARIAKLVVGNEPQPIVTGLPQNGGGALTWGPDGFLYAGTVDKSSQAQDPTSLAGKVLRFGTDGKAAPGNPFGDSLVYSVGHHDVRALSWDLAGRLYATESGQDTWDEVNLITAGGNYGWPTTQGQTGQPGTIDPVVIWAPNESDPAGVAVAGEVLVTGALDGQRLWLTPLTGDGRAAQPAQAALVEEYGRLRTVVNAPDGSLWVTTSNRDGDGIARAGDDRILRIVPPGGGLVELL